MFGFSVQKAINVIKNVDRITFSGRVHEAGSKRQGTAGTMSGAVVEVPPNNIRFQMELEFVQCLASPAYLNCTCARMPAAALIGRRG